MTNVKNVGFDLPADLGAENKKIQRQRQMAQLLQQQSLTPDQGQMVGGHYVAPSPLSALAKMLTVGMTNKKSEQLDQQEAEIGKKSTQMLVDGLQGYQNTLQGEEAQQFKVLDDEYGEQTATAPAVPGNKQAALAQLLQSGHPMLQEFGMKQMMAGPGKFSTTPQYDQSGRAFVMSEDGQVKYLDGIKARDKLEFRDLGGSQEGVNPFTGERVTSLAKTVSPDAVLSAETQRRGQNLTDSRSRTSNDLKMLELGLDQGSGLPILGAPVPTVTPWANQSNAKDANKVKLAEINRGSKEVEKDVEAARKLGGTKAAVERFIALNKEINTGEVADRVGITRSMQGMRPAYAEMEALTAQLAPQNRVEGSGATSDYDARQFERATVGVDKPRETNEKIGAAIIARADRAMEYADFRQTYLEQNGTLQGADRYWKEYVTKNPIFNPDKPGTFDLNEKRKSWLEYFSGKETGGAPAAPNSNAPKPGAVMDGYRFKGGDPSNPSNWEPLP